MAPGIYRVRLDRCQALHGSFAVWEVKFEFTVRGLEWTSRKLTLVVDTGKKCVADYVCRVFAVMGVILDDPSDLALACREVVGRHLFIEVLHGGELNVLQLATTHRVAAPESRLAQVPRFRLPRVRALHRVARPQRPTAAALLRMRRGGDPAQRIGVGTQ